IRLLRGLVHPDPAQRFATAEDAELSDEGAAGFLKELVKSDLSGEYATELRLWIAELESDAFEKNDRPNFSIPDGTTRLSGIQAGGGSSVLRAELSSSEAEFEVRN
ncbi:MAG: hypothetical protein ACK50J_04140, partial [Planctomyces sp.]